MKRLAICISGHMRSYCKTIDSFNNLLSNLRKKYECDIFIHTWNKKEAETPTYYSQENYDQEEITEELVKKIYNPVRLIIEEQKILDPNKTILHNQSIEGLMYSEKSKYKVNNLFKVNDYDFILCTRPDVFYYNYDIPELGEKENLWLSSVFHNNAASDVLIFGSANIVKVARNFWNEYPLYLSFFKFSNNEGYFQQYLKDNGIIFKYSKYCMPRDWKIVRSWLDVNDFPESDPLTWSKQHAEIVINFQNRWSYYR